MFIAATFEFDLHLELAISELEQEGVVRSGIAAIIMDQRVEPRRLIDSIHHADGISSFDAAALLGTFCMLMGAIYGFVLDWGPIVWGLIGFTGGGAVGLLLDLSLSKIGLKRGKRTNGSTSEARAGNVVLLIECDLSQRDMVKGILWDNLALGVGALP